MTRKEKRHFVIKDEKKKLKNDEEIKEKYSIFIKHQQEQEMKTKKKFIIIKLLKRKLITIYVIYILIFPYL